MPFSVREIDRHSDVGKDGLLLEAAQLLDARLRTIKTKGRIAGLERMAVMVALNFSAEALQGRKDMQLLEETLKQLDAKISQQLQANPDLPTCL